MAALGRTTSVIVDKSEEIEGGDLSSAPSNGDGAGATAKCSAGGVTSMGGVSFQEETAAVVLSSGEVVCFPKNKEFIAKYSGTSATPSVGEIAKMISKADCTADVARFRLSIADALREPQSESTDASRDSPLHSIAVAEVGTRELTVGELLLGRRQQLTTLKRLKQRIQEQKRRLELEQIRADEIARKFGGAQQRRKYARTPKADSDESQKPLCTITLEELARRSWGQKRAMRRFDAEDFIQLHNMELARRKGAQRIRRWDSSDVEKRSAANDCSNSTFPGSSIGLAELYSVAETLNLLAMKTEISTDDSASNTDDSTNFLLNSEKKEIDYEEFVNGRSPTEVAASASALISSIPLLSSPTSTPRRSSQFLSSDRGKECTVERPNDGEAFEHYLAAAIDNLSYDVPKGSRKVALNAQVKLEEGSVSEENEVKRPIFWKKLAKYRRAIEKKEVSDLEEQEAVLNAVVRHAYRLKWILARKPKARDDERKIAEVDELVEKTYKQLNAIRRRRCVESSCISSENACVASTASPSDPSGSVRCTRSMKRREQTSSTESSCHTSLAETKQFAVDVLAKLTGWARAYADMCCPKKEEGSSKTGPTRRKRKATCNLHLERKIRKKEALLKLIATFVEFDKTLHGVPGTDG